jgi:hypothetical protein
MTTEELVVLLEQGEGQRLEFKEDAIKPGDLAQTLVAMTNAQGGMLLLGVNDAGEPVGIRSYQQAYDLVMTAASQELCDPPIALAAPERITLPGGADILAITVPHSRQLHATHGRFLIRRGSQNVSLTTAEVAERSRHLATGGLIPLSLAGGYQALYEVRRFDATLEMLDAEGQTAVLERDQELCFLQDGVVGLYHQVWGEGELFDEYEVRPGVVADRFQLGSRHISLISLRQIKNRGDTLQLRIRRQIRGGWSDPEEWLELAVNHQTRRLRLTVIFPVKRPPQQAFVELQSTGTSRVLEPRRWQVDDQGRTVLTWQERQPVLGETYRLRWQW